MAYFGEYSFLRTINDKGGQADIVLVRHNEMEDIKALRVLKISIKSEEDEAFIKFKKECKKLLRLGNGHHPNIVQIYRPRFWKEPGENEGKAYVEMEFVDGKDLLKHLREDEQSFVPIEDVLRMAEQISSALAFCHIDVYTECMTGKEKKEVEDAENEEVRDEKIKKLIKKYRVVHNDIHSNNIMRRRKDGNFVLLDFGLAFDGTEVVRSSKMEGGVIPFMAPEKLKALQEERKLREEDLTPQLDIYGFGVVLYEYLTGQLPNKDSIDRKGIGQSIFESRKLNFEKKNPGEKYTKDYPDWLVDVIIKCLQKDPAKRFKDGKELHECIVNCINNKTTQGESIERGGEKSRNSSDESNDLRKEKERNNKKKWRAVLLIALSLFVSLGTYFGNRNKPVPNKVEIVAKPSDSAMGVVMGGGNYGKDTIITLTARAKSGFKFIKWDDGDMANPRKVKTVEKHEYVAIFKKVESPIDLGTGTANPTNPIKPVETGNSTTAHSIQQEFDELHGRFDLRMKDSLTYENALALITGDYEAINEILLMLDNYPNQITDSRNNYIERFQTRADEAIKKINGAVFSPLLTSSERDEMYSKYIPQKNEIEKMRNSL